MPRDSRGRYTERRPRPRLVGNGRRLRVVGVDYDGPEVGGVVSGAPIILGAQPAPAPAPAPKTTSTASTTSSTKSGS